MDQISRTPYLNSLIDKILVKTYLKDVQVEILNGTIKGNNYLGDLYKIVVKNGDEVKSFYIKTAATDPKFRKIARVPELFFRESVCYEKIFPKMDRIQDKFDIKDRFKHIKCIHTSLEDNSEAILMEDLSQFEYKTIDRSEFLDWDMLQLTAKTMANFHALSFYMKNKHPEDFEETVKDIKSMGYVGDIYLDLFSECIRQSLQFIKNDDRREKFTKIYPSVKETVKSFFDHTTSEPYNCLLQGDCWFMNLMFKFENKKAIDLILLDWQWSRIASPIVDISVVLFLNTNLSTRRKHYFEFYDIYYNQLGKRLQEMGGNIHECYPRPIYEEHIKIFSLYGIVLGIVGACFLHAKDGLDIIELGKEGADFKHCPESKRQMNEVIEDAFYFGLLK